MSRTNSENIGVFNPFDLKSRNNSKADAAKSLLNLAIRKEKGVETDVDLTQAGAKHDDIALIEANQ